MKKEKTIKQLNREIKASNILMATMLILGSVIGYKQHGIKAVVSLWAGGAVSCGAAELVFKYKHRNDDKK